MKRLWVGGLLLLCGCDPKVVLGSLGQTKNPLPGSADAGVACNFGEHWECNESPSVSSQWGTCQADGTCSCNAGFMVSPVTGRCAPQCPVTSTCSSLPDSAKPPVLTCATPIAAETGKPFRVDLYGENLDVNPSSKTVKVDLDGTAYTGQVIDNCHVQVDFPAVSRTAWLPLHVTTSSTSAPVYIDLYASPGAFSCGTLSCSRANEYCEVVTSDVPEFNGAYQRFACKPLPACTVKDTCSCLGAAATCEVESTQLAGTCSHPASGGTLLGCNLGG